MKIFYSWKELVEMKARDAIKETAERNKWMQEEIARLREDAERYRWLRSQTKISDSRFYDMPKKISSLNFTPGTRRDYNSRFDSCSDNTRKEKT